MGFLDSYTPQVHGALRIITALLFLAHGTAKLFNFPAMETSMAGNLPPLILAAAIIEVVGGTLVALGFYSRFAAFICSGLMAFAYFIAHQPRDFFPLLNGGEPAILFCFVFLFIAAAGPGACSLNTR